MSDDASIGLKEHLTTLFVAYDVPFGQDGAAATAKVAGYLLACKGRSLDLVARAVGDFIAGAVDRPANRRYKLPTSEELGAHLKLMMNADGTASSRRIYAPPFGPLWGVNLYALLLTGPDKSMPAPSRFVAAEIAKGGDMAKRYRLEHQANNGFRAVTFVLQGAADAKGCTVDERLQPLVSMFEPVPAEAAAFGAWKIIHVERGWPWLPDLGKQRVAYFPKDGSEGLERLRVAIIEMSAGPPDKKTVCGAA
ncbi:MAG: hypothetical protein E5W19_28075 [Mesorhizobium sp.]|nr:MAG: hypothetical protein E5W19_28075 [Mesorhizobium sp.]